MRYDYKCPKCGAIKTVRHGMLEKPIVRCDVCGSEMKKLISGGTAIFIKGKISEYARYHGEGKERADARNDFIKKHPYEPVPKDLL